jgi:diaminohydroxyphosphoribosylaminopyrimidine deaminase/5-amino-6-(5-phosphoribosylamino)uracil reductase
MDNDFPEADLLVMQPAVVDRYWMAESLRLAECGLYTTDPNPRVGSVVVRDGRAVGRGTHWRAGEAHAEVLALREAGPLARGATVYVTLEPCAHFGRTPPCADALIAAGVARVVVAVVDPNPKVAGRGIARLRAAGIAVEVGILAEAARELNVGFFHRMETGRPFVRVKLASSLDGRTAMASGESQWITGPAARQDVQHWRARASALLTGSGTVCQDDPWLTVRQTPTELLRRQGWTGETATAHATHAATHAGDHAAGHASDHAAHHAAGHASAPALGALRQPPRIVIDTGLQCPLTARIFTPPLAGPVWVLTTPAQQQSAAAQRLQRRGVEVLAVETGTDGHLDLEAVLLLLGQRGINELHVEAGAGLVGALARAGCVNEWLLYMAPCLMGSSARPLLEWSLQQMTERVPLQILALDKVGTDLRLRARPQSS